MCLICMQLQEDMSKLNGDLQAEMDRRKVPKDHQEELRKVMNKKPKLSLTQLRDKYWNKKEG